MSGKIFTIMRVDGYSSAKAEPYHGYSSFGVSPIGGFMAGGRTIMGSRLLHCRVAVVVQGVTPNRVPTPGRQVLICNASYPRCLYAWLTIRRTLTLVPMIPQEHLYGRFHQQRRRRGRVRYADGNCSFPLGLHISPCNPRPES